MGAFRFSGIFHARTRLSDFPQPFDFRAFWQVDRAERNWRISVQSP